MALPIKQRLIYIIRIPFLYIVFLFQDLYCLIKSKKPDPLIRLDGKVALVTGANRGIGKQIVIDFYKRGAKVILACREINSAIKVCSEISNGEPSDRLVPLKMDLTLFSSIRQACKDLQSNLNCLDILISNAGMFGSESKKITVDGYDETCQVNFLAPCLLTHYLMPLLSASPSGGRIVMVSSEFHLIPYSFNCDLFVPSSTNYDSIINYAMSKFCLNGFALKMADQIKDKRVTINTVHPGCVKTDIVGKDSSCFTRLSNRVQQAIRGVSVETGAQGPVYVAIDPSLDQVSGKYFIGGCIFTPNKRLLSETVQNQIWNFIQPCLTSHSDVNQNKDESFNPISSN